MIKIILSEELITKIKNNKRKCTYLNDDYVILYKSMGVLDSQLDEYLSRIKNAQESGINIPKVIEYKLLNEKNGLESLGIFVEERAKGNVLNERGIILEEGNNYNFSDIITTYLEKVTNYLTELKRRAEASQEIYDKFLNDYINIHKYGLRPDPNSLNFLFDEKIGYTIIDPYINDEKTIDEKNLFRYIVNDIYGVSCPKILIKKDKIIKGFSYLTPELKNKLTNYSDEINRKISKAFKNKGFSLDYILNSLENNKKRFYSEEESLNFSELVAQLKEYYCNNINFKR